MKLLIKIYSWQTLENGQKAAKSYVMVGEEATKKYKDKLQSMNGRFNKFLRVGGKDSTDDTRESGWIFGAKGWQKVETWLQELKDPDLEIVKSWENK